MGDRPGHKFRGNQWTKGARGSGSAPTVKRYETDWSQDRLRHPMAILGAQHSPEAVNSYLEKGGAKMTDGAPLPDDVQRGPQGQCYMNATQLVINDPDRFDYAEGFAYSGEVGTGIAFMHAWAVEKKTGKVVDPTWPKPESSKYYGVTYERKKVFRHFVKTRMYGVLGGDPFAADEVMKRGGL